MYIERERVILIGVFKFNCMQTMLNSKINPDEFQVIAFEKIYKEACLIYSQASYAMREVKL